MAPSLQELIDPSHTALLIQEVQTGVLGKGAHLAELAEAAEARGIVERIAHLSRAARGAGVPVIHCTAQTLPGGFGVNVNARLFAGARKRGLDTAGMGPDTGRPLAELDPADSDLIVPRYHGLSPLTGTQLDSLLRNRAVSTLVITGVSLNLAIPNLVFDSVNRAYQTVLVTDAVAGVPADYGDQVIAHSLAFLATLHTTEDLVDAWAHA